MGQKKKKIGQNVHAKPKHNDFYVKIKDLNTYLLKLLG